MPDKFFRTFKRQGAFWPASENCYKNCLPHLNHLKLGTTHLWTLTKILKLAM